MNIIILMKLICSVKMIIENNETLKNKISDYSAKEINDYKETVHNEYSEKLKKYRRIKDAHELIMNYGIKIDENAYDDVFRNIELDLIAIEEYSKTVDDVIKEKQDTCEHDMVYQGHDSHYDYYKCRKCGKEERW